MPTPYQDRRRAQTRQSVIAVSSSKSAAPNRCASKRRTMSSPTAASVNRLSRVRLTANPSALARRAQHGQERLLRDLDAADALHARLARFLLSSSLALAGDVAAVALGENVLAHRPDRFAGDHVGADRR